MASLKWQAGPVALPIPDNWRQIQWGSHVEQLGRGANKIVLDGAASNPRILGTLTLINDAPMAATTIHTVD